MCCLEAHGEVMLWKGSANNTKGNTSGNSGGNVEDWSGSQLVVNSDEERD